MAHPAQFLPARGDLFETKYRIQDPIGQGGYARVYRALDVEMRRDVAIKILTPSTDGEGYEDRIVSRFLREGRLISELHDPHTITLHDYGRASSGLLYMVFEFVDGTPLDKLIRKDAPMPPTRVARIMLQVLASLTEAHLVGVLHRDIKPSNLMVYDYMGDTDRVKVLDFGIAKPVASEREVSAELTREGVIIGTPRYMSPEQVIGTELSPASDLFSVGLVALEMLSGRRALKGDDDQSVLRALLGPEPVEIPEDILIPAPMRSIITRMVNKEVTERFRSTVEVIEAIHAWLSGRAVDGWIDPETSKTLSRVHTRELAGPSSRAREAFSQTTTIQWAAMIGVFLLGGLSTYAVFRVTSLQARLEEMRQPPAIEAEGVELSIDDLGQTQWLIVPDHPALRYRFMGADGVIETDSFEKVPTRSMLAIEVVLIGFSQPEGQPLLGVPTPDGVLQVRTISDEALQDLRETVPLSWEIVTNVRGRALAVSNAIHVARERERRKETRRKVEFDIPLVKP